MVVLGLGSNCGDRLLYLRTAIQFLKSPRVSPHLQVISSSPLYESDALLPDGAPDSWNQPFLNLNLLCKTTLSPVELLHHVKAIEEKTGRKQRGRWAPREIDIDILAMGSLVLQQDHLTIPHSRLLERPFALLPLADLLPEWIYPVATSPQASTQISDWVAPWKRLPVAQVPFRTRRSQLSLTDLVGILNVTPDSFSDGGLFINPELALKHAQELIAQGARILDIGAESTRPGAQSLSPVEEWKRLEPVLRALKSIQPKDPMTLHSKIKLSVDTRHAEVAQKAIQLGIDWINDVTGFEDQLMKKIAAESSVDLVVMHSLSVPPVRTEVLSLNSDPVSHLLQWGEKRIQELNDLGIHPERIIFDPGFGFGKTFEQSWEIFRQLRRFQELGVRILVGHSRKSFLSTVTDRPSSDRDVESITLSLDLAKKGIDYLRVHHIEMNARCLKTWTQSDGITQYGL